MTCEPFTFDTTDQKFDTIELTWDAEEICEEGDPLYVTVIARRLHRR